MVAFGRLPESDPRAFGFLLANDPMMTSVVKRGNVYHMYAGKPYDQGEYGTCVGHGAKLLAASSPVVSSHWKKAPGPVDFYLGACANDAWDDNDNGDLQFGSSVHGAMRWMRSEGYVSAYGWAYDVDSAANWLGGLDAAGKRVGGPLVIGVNWYAGMFDTDAEGFVRVSGYVAGGHCVCLLGWNETRGFAYGINSWGASWGKNGRFKIFGEDLARLLREDGEAATATETKKVA